MTPNRTLGVLGARGLVGRPLLERLTASGHTVVAVSRSASPAPKGPASNPLWIRTGDPLPAAIDRVATWITLCPIWSVPEHLAWLEATGIESLVAVSSTSVVTKQVSCDADERGVAARLFDAEVCLRRWAALRGAQLCILRPTMIYDGVHDGNVAAMTAFIRRRGWFPVAGPARGLRQPVHADDVAGACVAAALAGSSASAYTLSGAEPLPFVDLVATVFRTCGMPPRIVHVPRPLWRVAARLARLVGLAGAATAGMADRMNDDLAFDHTAAARDLGFRPRPFSIATLDASGGATGASRLPSSHESS
jgi:nucleoside-diphosphate-sugar epimerase